MQIESLMIWGDFSLVVNATLPAFNKSILHAACTADLEYVVMPFYRFLVCRIALDMLPIVLEGDGY